MLLMNIFNRGILVIGVSLVACCELTAGAICVKVTDYADLPLHDAWVTVRDVHIGQVISSRTDRHGGSCVSQIAEGIYSVEVGLTGFMSVRYFPVRLTALGHQQLGFRLPFAQITEGGVTEDAILTGTLKQDERAVNGANICVLNPHDGFPITCAVTDDLGEYALSFPPGAYKVEVKVAGRTVHRSRIQLAAPGIYRNRITLQ